MLADRIRLPFSLDNIYGGFAQLSGIIRAGKEHVILEFRVEGAILSDFLKSAPKVVQVPLRDIESFELKSTLFAKRVIMHLLRLDAVQALPKASGSQASELVLKIKRKDLDRAKQLVSYLNLRISELRLEDTDQSDLYA